MTLKKVQEILQAEVICGENLLDIEIHFAGGADLMSDALAFGKPGLLLLTGLTNSQSVRTADIIGAKAIVYVRGKKPAKDVVEFAQSKNIPLLSTKFMMFTACGRLFSHNLPGVNEFKGKKSNAC